MKTVPQALADLGAIYKQRNAIYGNNYKLFGHAMTALFPDGITIKTEEDWNRLSLFLHCADKLSRYAASFKQGGHVDSLDDLSVYAQMLQEVDGESSGV